LDVVVEQVKECRHIHDVPVLRLVGTDHHVSALSASKRGERSWGSTGSCPVESQSAGSGGGCVPVPRGAELRSCQVSEGALANWIQEAARRCCCSRRRGSSTRWDHVDETEGRVKGEARMGFTSTPPTG
jgi:hypothetical protein